MPDKTYCYPNTNTLVNKLNIRNEKELFNAEQNITFARLKFLQNNPLKGNFDFEHLKNIHKYIFQDIYEWAGEIRTVEIGKGNLFCTTPCINDFAKSVFDKYFPQCFDAKDNPEKFVRVLAENYGDLNALHPFREGNGRAQREFARLVCLECGYDFNLSNFTHSQMLEASILSFNKGDNSKFVEIFSEAVKPVTEKSISQEAWLNILTADDLSIEYSNDNYNYNYEEYSSQGQYNEYYQEKIKEMNIDNKAYNESKNSEDILDRNSIIEFSDSVSLTIPANIKLIKTRTFSDCQNLRYLKLECDLDAIENINVFDYCSDDLQIELSTGEIISLEELDNLLDEKLIEDNEISR